MKKRIILPILLAIIFTLGVALVACNPAAESKPVTVAQPVYSGSALTYGDDLPVITTTTTGGAISLDKNQTLTAGTKDYSWTFTPEDTEIEYTNLKGTISLTVNKADQTIPQETELECSDISDTEVTLVSLGSSYEYSVSTGQSGSAVWQPDNVFSGLTQQTDYTFYARLKCDDNHNPSAAIELEVKTAETPETSDLYFVYKGDTIISLTELGYEQTSLVIPSKQNNVEVKIIDEMAFMYADLLESIKIPFGIEVIGYGAFEGCNSLEEMFIPASVSSVGDNIFGGCYSLTNVYYGGSTLDGWGINNNSATTIFYYSEAKSAESSDSWRYVNNIPTPWYMSVIQPTYNKATLLFYGNELPKLTTLTKGGTIELDKSQILTAGIKDYSWTFTPYDDSITEFTNITGTISIEVYKSRQYIPSHIRLESEETLETKVTLRPLGSNYEYSVDGTNWQDSNVFEDLTQITEYTFYARLKGNDNLWASESITVSVRTLQADPIVVEQPAYSGGTLYYGDALPVITTSTTGGTIVLDANQTLDVGTHDYNWTFTPDNGDIQFTGLTGTISLTVLKAAVTVLQPVYSGETLYYGDALPAITTSTTGGTVTLDADQTLAVGTHDYNWTFTPDSTDNYEYSNLTGVISITVQKASQTIPQGTELQCANATDTEITLSPLGDSYEYSMDNSSWQDSNIFAGLTQMTKYTFYARLKGDDNRNPSESIEKEIYTAQDTTVTVEQPVYNGGTLYYGESLPAISTVTPGGTVALDEEQTLAAGTHDYTWTFTPDNEEFEYLNVTGTISLTVEKANQNVPENTVLHAEVIGERSVRFIISTGSDDKYEFSMDTISWQDSGVFGDLTPDTEYTFYARLKGGENHEPSSPIFKDVRTKVEVTDPGYDLLYEFEGGTITAATDYADDQESLTIPGEYNGTPITTIGEGVFYYFMQLKSIVISDSITTIEAEAFTGCYSLTKIFYCGTADDWSNINIDETAFDFSISSLLYFYSEEQPEEPGNYWRYVDGVATAW